MASPVTPNSPRPSPAWPTPAPTPAPTFRAPRAGLTTATPPYHQDVPMTATLLLILVPAVIAAAAMRPGRGRGGGRGGGRPYGRR